MGSLGASCSGDEQAEHAVAVAAAYLSLKRLSPTWPNLKWPSLRWPRTEPVSQDAAGDEPPEDQRAEDERLRTSRLPVRWPR